MAEKIFLYSMTLNYPLKYLFQIVTGETVPLNQQITAQLLAPTMVVRRRLEQLQQLTFSEWKVMLQSMIALPMAGLSLRAKGLLWTQARLLQYNPPAPQTTLPETDQLRISQCVARMVSITASHGLYRTNCLKISLVTGWLLQRRGITTKLVIGVNKAQDNLNAHAWIEYRGEPLLEMAENFSAFGQYE